VAACMVHCLSQQYIKMREVLSTGKLTNQKRSRSKGVVEEVSHDSKEWVGRRNNRRAGLP
jgi:hypothetical protein